MLGYLVSAATSILVEIFRVKLFSIIDMYISIFLISVPKPVFQTKKIYSHPKIIEEEVLTPQHEEIIKYINDCKYEKFQILR